MKMYEELIEKASFYDREWYKIKTDDAFQYVIGDWYKGYQEAYFTHLRSRNVAIQAGGYCGIYPKLFSESFNVVYTFEPDPLNFYCLTLNCQSDNIVKAQGALGAKHERVNLSRNCPTNNGMNKVYADTSAFLPTYKIDDLDLFDCSLIQLDTEGYEHNILIGAIETIVKYKPVIAVEDSHQGIVDLLEPLGYTIKSTIDRDTVFAI